MLKLDKRKVRLLHDLPRIWVAEGEAVLHICVGRPALIRVYLYAVESAGKIAGLTAFANEGGEEVVVVNIVGDIDPQTLGRLLANLNDFDIEEIMEGFEQ